jgi:hypothetical protein
MVNNLNQADQLVFIGGELEMARNEGPTEESEGSSILVEDGAEPLA